MLDVLIDTLLDTAKLIPFLFITYLILDIVEKKSSEKTLNMLVHADIGGPIIGSLVGVVPQCGFSASAASLYAQRFISVGSLMAVFLATSDEMLPILISHSVPALQIIKILALKVISGIVVGLFLDKVLRLFSNKREKTDYYLEFEEGCSCAQCSSWYSALSKTLQITVFIFIVTFVLNTVIYCVGTDSLSGIILNKPILGSLLSAAVGLIPNCAASVVITELYLEGAMSTGAMMSGLLSASGVGILVLFRVNSAEKKENLVILGILYLSGFIIGTLIGALRIVI